MSSVSEGNFPPEKVDELLKLSKKVCTSVQALKYAGDSLNLRDYALVFGTIKQHLEKFQGIWQDVTELSDSFGEQAQAFFNSSSYPWQLESALNTQQIPFSGDFPNYDIPPFKLSIKLDQCLVKLSMGKKNYQTHSLSPSTLATWVAKHYKALINSPFNQERFCRELLSVYSFLSHDSWGVPVPIKDVYNLLTLKNEARQVYPESLFVFDLSRLLKEYEIRHNEYIFDFSSHKQNDKNYTIVNQQGIERAISNMTIRKTAVMPDV